MLKKSFIVAGAVLFAASAFAQTPTSSTAPPGQQMQKAKKSTGPGASKYAPGQKMKIAKKAGTTGPGASDFAPGRQTTTGISKMKK